MDLSWLLRRRMRRHSGPLAIASLLVLIVFVLAGAWHDTTRVQPVGPADSSVPTSAGDTGDVTAAAQAPDNSAPDDSAPDDSAPPPADEQAPTGGLLAVQGDAKRIANGSNVPSPCALRYAANGQALPDPVCTPGVIATRVTQANVRDTICVPGYTTGVRPLASVTNKLKVVAVMAYGLSPDRTIAYDHLVPLDLGGANDTRNLWPQPATSAAQSATANSKDTVEKRLHSLVCDGRMHLGEAQRRIAADWTTALQ